jgi:hypothetical protein
MRIRNLLLPAILLLPSTAWSQDRDTKVRNDREAFQSSSWIYNDLKDGIAAAKVSGRPLLVVFRCIPCEACQAFDDDVARRDPIIRDLMDEFVCVRIVQANAIDLTRFQFDFDQSMAIILMNPDGTIYGRYGTRSDRPEDQDISLEGLRKALDGALALHRDYARVRPSLAGKQPRPTPFRSPREYPSLAGRYEESLNYDGPVAKSCIHCHQIREAERLIYRSQGDPIPDEVLYPYPDPEVLGLAMDPKERTTIARVAPGSPGERDGLRPGDAIASLDGQPLLSIADFQWVLHNAPKTGSLEAAVERDGTRRHVTIHLEQGWRRGNLSWRATSWDLRRMALGGLKATDLTDEARETAGLPRDAMALRVDHVGEFGEHALAKKAGILKGDLIVGFDGRNRRMSESDLIAYVLQQEKRPGDRLQLELLRDGERKTVELRLQ